MPRTEIALQQLPPNGGGLDEVTFSEASSSSDHYFDNSSGRVLLLMKNSHSEPQTATVVSVPDEYGRTGDVSITCEDETGFCVYGPFAPKLFNQRGAGDLGRVFINLESSTGVSFAAIELP